MAFPRPTVQKLVLCLPLACLLLLSPELCAKDYFLTLGGGPHPAMNQVSLEKNVLLFQRTLSELGLANSSNDVFFGDGDYRGKDVKVLDPDAVPKANRLMAEFLGDTDSLGLAYRDHQIPNVLGANAKKNVKRWFNKNGKQLTAGDRLVVYVTAHGSKSGSRRDAYNTTIALWDNSSLPMKEFVQLLDGLDQDVTVVVVMVQCHAGGFARMMYNDGDPDEGLSKQRRIGFYATVHDRPAAGCTPEIDEKNYQEYSSYFWPALSGRDRVGGTLDKPDYNEDGVTSLDEAHAYVLLTADTIDIPMKTSGEFLSEFSDFGDEDDDDGLLNDHEPFERILQFATPTQRAVLLGLSDQLKLRGSSRVKTALRATETRSRRGRSRVVQNPDLQRSKEEIAKHLKKKWPQLSNLLNPKAIELLTNRKQEFIREVEGLSAYRRYVKAKRESKTLSDDKKRAKYNRFIRIADNVVFAENLKRLGTERYEEYQELVAMEAMSLGGVGRLDTAPVTQSQ